MKPIHSTVDGYTIELSLQSKGTTTKRLLLDKLDTMTGADQMLLDALRTVAAGRPGNVLYLVTRGDGRSQQPDEPRDLMPGDSWVEIRNRTNIDDGKAIAVVEISIIAVVSANKKHNGMYWACRLVRDKAATIHIVAKDD